MTAGGLTVSTPARLHFGLLRFGDPNGLSFGGLGMMIRAPRTVVSIRRSTRWTSTGVCANLALTIAKRSVASALAESLKGLVIEVHQAAPRHRGFGSGTQLALAVTSGVNRLLGRDILDVSELAQAAERGRRSAIGTHGFLQGGLLWERSRSPEQRISQLETRVSIPDSWRVLLLLPRCESGQHGPDEAALFHRLPTVPGHVTARLETLATEEILPAAIEADFARFADHVESYGELAGNCFRSVQGGPFANRQVSELVAAARAAGGKGVGQTSWGPTVFAFADNQEAAEAVAQRLSETSADGSLAIAITQADNQGAVFSELPSH